MLRFVLSVCFFGCYVPAYGHGLRGIKLSYGNNCQVYLHTQTIDAVVEVVGYRECDGTVVHPRSYLCSGYTFTKTTKGKFKNSQIFEIKILRKEYLFPAKVNPLTAETFSKHCPFEFVPQLQAILKITSFSPKNLHSISSEMMFASRFARDASRSFKNKVSEKTWAHTGRKISLSVYSSDVQYFVGNHCA